MEWYQDVLVKDSRFKSPGRVSIPTMLEPLTLVAVNGIIADAAQQGIDLRVFETYRSRERQAELYAKGASDLQRVGVHHYGLACDLVVYVCGEPNWKVSYAFLGPLAEKWGVVWGGSWPRRKDLVHVQRCKVADQEQLFAGSFYPDENYQATEAA